MYLLFGKQIHFIIILITLLKLVKFIIDILYNRTVMEGRD
jgi:hypothetical protein